MAQNYIKVASFGKFTYDNTNHKATESDGVGQYDTILLTGLSASRLVATAVDKSFVSVTDLSSWVAGTANQVAVANDGDGTITLSTPQDMHTEASPTFAGLTLVNTVTGFSIDNTLAGDSNSAVPTEKAVKAYVDNHFYNIDGGYSGSVYLSSQIIDGGVA